MVHVQCLLPFNLFEVTRLKSMIIFVAVWLPHGAANWFRPLAPLALLALLVGEISESSSLPRLPCLLRLPYLQADRRSLVLPFCPAAPHRSTYRLPRSPGLLCPACPACPIYPRWPCLPCLPRTPRQARRVGQVRQAEQAGRVAKINWCSHPGKWGEWGEWRLSANLLERASGARGGFQLIFLVGFTFLIDCCFIWLI